MSEVVTQKFRIFEQILREKKIVCLDEVCVELELSMPELEKKLKHSEHIFTFYK